MENDVIHENLVEVLDKLCEKAKEARKLANELEGLAAKVAVALSEIDKEQEKKTDYDATVSKTTGVYNPYI